MLDFDKIKNRLGNIKGKYYSDPMFAEDLGVSFKTIHNWKTAKTSPRLKDMEKIKQIGKFDSLDEIVC